MFALTRQEKVLVTLVLISLLIGSVVKHRRQIYRAHHLVPQEISGSPKSRASSD